MNADTLKPRELIGQTIRLATPHTNPHTIKWRVIGYGSGDIRLKSVHNKKVHSVDWPQLRQYLQSGRLILES